MIGMTRPANEFVPGTRVIAAADKRHDRLDGIVSWMRWRVETVVNIEAREGRADAARLVLASPDGEREIGLENGLLVERGPWKIVWTDPLPEDDETAIAYARTAIEAPSYEGMLLWVGMANAGLMYCHLVTDRNDHDNGEMPIGGGFGMTRGAFLVSRPEHPVGAGDLIGCRHERCDENSGVALHHVSGARTVMTGTSPETIGRVLKAAERRPGVIMSSNFAGMGTILEAEDLAHARTQPSEALVLVWNDGGQQMVHVIGSTGKAFHRQDDVAATIEGDAPGPGLWRLVNAEAWANQSYEGEWDCGIDGQWLPAEQSDAAKWIGTDEAADREIVEITGEFTTDAFAAQVATARRTAARTSTA